MATTINVANEDELRAAIFEISNDFAIDGSVNGSTNVVGDTPPYTINITANILLGQSLPMIRGVVAIPLTINGNGFTIDGQNLYRVFFVESGTVAINNVIILDAAALGGDGGYANNDDGGGGGGGLGAGAAVFVNAGAAVTLTGVVVQDAEAVGGAGGNGGTGVGGGSGGGGGGGLGGDGGRADDSSGAGGGGYEGTGGDFDRGGGGGGEFGDGGPGGDLGGGGGGGQQGNGGTGAGGETAGGGGEGGGATADGEAAIDTNGGTGGSPEGGDGGNTGFPGNPVPPLLGVPLGGGGGGGDGSGGGSGAVSGGGGGTGISSDAPGGDGGLGGGGGGAMNQNAGSGGDFGGGGGSGNADNLFGGDGGFGGGGGGAPTNHPGTTGGTSAFGGGGGGATTGGASTGGLGGHGGSGPDADGGGGAALGGAIFVRAGGTLIISDSDFTGSYGVTGGTTPGQGGATGGQAHGTVMFLHGASTTTLNVSSGVRTIAGTDPLAGDIAGSGNLVKIGDGTLILGGTNNYTGTTTVNDGLLQVDGSIVSTTFINNGGTLGGNGTTGAVNVAAGDMAPGASAGILNTGSIAFAAGAIFAAELGGTGAGQFDRLNVTGTVDFGGATLAATLIGGFNPSLGDSFTIITNDGVDAVAGTLAGLAEGARFDLGSARLQISYAGGDGNDVTLTAVADPVISSNGGGPTASVTVAENTFAVTTAAATDADGPALSFAIAGGADAAQFVIDTLYATLSFIAPPDFEAPADADGNNVYEVIVQVSDGAGIDLQALSVSVTNVNGVRIEGTDGNDIVKPGKTVAGEPFPTGEEDRIFGFFGDDRLAGADGNDVLIGSRGNDRLVGGEGDDRLAGGFGRNVLIGGADADRFVFNERLGLGVSLGFDDPLGHSRVVGFTVGVDKIVLADAVFKSLAHIDYDAATGALTFDPGAPGGGDIQFATLAKNLAISDADFVLV